jgi:small subunit ribosomal protein S27Ae
MAKKKVKPKRPSKRYSLYQASGEKVERKNRFCPKCGVGIFMAKHQDRLVCGTCHYTEFVRSEKPAEKKTPEKKVSEKKLKSKT